MLLYHGIDNGIKCPSSAETTGIIAEVGPGPAATTLLYREGASVAILPVYVFI